MKKIISLALVIAMLMSANIFAAENDVVVENTTKVLELEKDVQEKITERLVDKVWSSAIIVNGDKVISLVDSLKLIAEENIEGNTIVTTQLIFNKDGVAEFLTDDGNKVYDFAYKIVDGEIIFDAKDEKKSFKMKGIYDFASDKIWTEQTFDNGVAYNKLYVNAKNENLKKDIAGNWKYLAGGINGKGIKLSDLHTEIAKLTDRKIDGQKDAMFTFTEDGTLIAKNVRTNETIGEIKYESIENLSMIKIHRTTEKYDDKYVYIKPLDVILHKIFYDGGEVTRVLVRVKENKEEIKDKDIIGAWGHKFMFQGATVLNEKSLIDVMQTSKYTGEKIPREFFVVFTEDKVCYMLMPTSQIIEEGVWELDENGKITVTVGENKYDFQYDKDTNNIYSIVTSRNVRVVNVLERRGRALYDEKLAKTKWICVERYKDGVPASKIEYCKDLGLEDRTLNLNRPCEMIFRDDYICTHEVDGNRLDSRLICIGDKLYSAVHNKDGKADYKFVARYDAKTSTVYTIEIFGDKLFYEGVWKQVVANEEEIKKGVVGKWKYSFYSINGNVVPESEYVAQVAKKENGDPTIHDEYYYEINADGTVKRIVDGKVQTEGTWRVDMPLDGAVVFSKEFDNVKYTYGNGTLYRWHIELDDGYRRNSILEKIVDDTNKEVAKEDVLGVWNSAMVFDGANLGAMDVQYIFEKYSYMYSLPRNIFNKICIKDDKKVEIKYFNNKVVECDGELQEDGAIKLIAPDGKDVAMLVYDKQVKNLKAYINVGENKAVAAIFVR